jgi:hypothetical protein
MQETNLALLNRLCIREGYSLKITNGKAIIYDERKQETSSPVKSIYPYDLVSKYVFKSVTESLKSSCNIRYFLSSGELIEFNFETQGYLGGALNITERVNSQAEAERFAKGYLRDINKYETIGNIIIKLNTGIAAGNVIKISGIGYFEGSYFVDRIIHNLTKNLSILRLRKPLEGY